MKVEFLDDLTDVGKHPYADPVRLIRIFDFDLEEAINFRNVIKGVATNMYNKVDLTDEPFIEGINCNLILSISEMDKGILTEDGKTFHCYLTSASYNQIIYFLEPFCNAINSGGYQWLYDPTDDEQIDLLLSPGGSW